MKSSGHRQGEREITYRIGLRKGTITAGLAKSKEEGGVVPETVRSSLMRGAVWRPVPFLPAPVLFALFCAAPAICFGVIVWLVYRIVHIPD